MSVVVQIEWCLANSAVKISILDLYLRTFPVRKFRIVTYVMMAFTMFYILVIVLETVLLCHPFAYNWDKSIKGGSCADLRSACLSAGILNLLIDVAIVSLPMPMLWGLQLPSAKKAAICGIFGIGYIICVITILRLIAILHLDYSDITFNAAPAGYWSILEPTLGILNACLPVMQPVLHKLFGSRALSYTSDPKNSDNRRHWLSGSTFSKKRPVDDSQLSRFKRLTDVEGYPLKNVTGTETCVTVSRGKSEEDGEVIMIKTDWNVHSNTVA